MSLLGYGLAGALQGAGSGLAKQANANKAAALEKMRQSLVDNSVRTERENRTSVPRSSPAFQAEATGLDSGGSPVPVPTPKPTGEMREFLRARGQGFDGTLQDYRLDMKKMAGEVDRTAGDAIAPNRARLDVAPDDGGSQIDTGISGLSPANRDKVQERVLDVQEQQQRLKRIQESVKDEYLTLSGRVIHMFNRARALVDPRNFSAEEREAYAEYTTWQQITVDNLNRAVQDLAGVEDASQIMSTMPNVDDDPIAFRAKLDSVIEQLGERLVLYARQQGKDAPSEIKEGEKAVTGDLPAGFQQRRSLNGKRYIQDKNGNWFEE